MNTWERFNHTVAIPMFSSLTHLRRRLMKPLMRNARREEAWLVYPANMHFEQGLRHWVAPVDPRALKSGVLTSGAQGRPSAFLLVTKAPYPGMITLRQTIKADDYRGKKLRFSGEVKAEKLEQPGGLYIRTDVLHWRRIQEEFGGEQPGDPSNKPDTSMRHKI